MNLDHINMDQILGRQPIPLELDEIAEFIKDKVILVTGAGGSIGSELCRQIAGFQPAKLILLGHGENSIFHIDHELNSKFPETITEPVIADIQDGKRLTDVFSYYQPHVIFHAAAHKHVPLMEKNSSEAVKNNVFGTRNVAQCALDHQTEYFVLISSDKAVNSTSVMGATKRLAESMVLHMGKSRRTKFLVVRLGNVLGSRGSVVPLFKQQIQEGGPITITHPEMVRYFMTIPEAVRLILLACTIAKGGDIFIPDMGEPVKIADLAVRLIHLAGLVPDEDIKIVYTGARPGEKLVEEMFTADEKIKVTKHNSIYVCDTHLLPHDQLCETLNQLEEMITREQTITLSDEIRTVIKQLSARRSNE